MNATTTVRDATTTGPDAAAVTGRGVGGARRGGVRAAVLTVIVSLIASILSVLGAGTAAAADPFFVATLSTNPDHAAAESGAGLKVAMMEMNWAKYEPQEGVFDTNYENQMKVRLAALKAAGMQVTLGLGLHYTPAWVKAQPNSRFVDEYGNTSAEANFVFNQKLRDQAGVYFRRINTALRFSSFWALRINSGAKSEVLYPQGGHYWASDVNAQNGPNLPSSQARNPFPGWKPGTTGLTSAQTLQWANWYVGALADTVRWQALTIDHLGFTGYIQVLTPGIGVINSKLLTLAAQNLPDGTLGLGAAWGVLYSKLTTVPHIVVYTSSLADGSKNDNGCAPTDITTPLDGLDTTNWSAARWQARIADQYGYGKSGENPGYPSTPAAQAHYTDPTATGMMAIAMNQARTCNYQGIYWAHDDQIWNNTLPLTQLTAYTTTTATTPANA